MFTPEALVDRFIGARKNGVQLYTLYFEVSSTDEQVIAADRDIVSGVENITFSNTPHRLQQFVSEVIRCHPELQTDVLAVLQELQKTDVRFGQVVGDGELNHDDPNRRQCLTTLIPTTSVTSE